MYFKCSASLFLADFSILRVWAKLNVVQKEIGPSKSHLIPKWWMIDGDVKHPYHVFIQWLSDWGGLYECVRRAANARLYLTMPRNVGLFCVERCYLVFGVSVSDVSTPPREVNGGSPRVPFSPATLRLHIISSRSESESKTCSESVGMNPQHVKAEASGCFLTFCLYIF